jgi:hypothetical protein
MGARHTLQNGGSVVTLVLCGDLIQDFRCGFIRVPRPGTTIIVFAEKIPDIQKEITLIFRVEVSPRGGKCSRQYRKILIMLR